MDVGEVIRQLEQLGLPRDQAECYAQLSWSGESSAGRLAKQLPTSRSQVYKTLHGLAERGYVRTIVANPMRFRPIPPSELFQALAESARHKLDLIHKSERDLAPLLAGLPNVSELDQGLGLDVLTTRPRIMRSLCRILDDATRDVKVVVSHPFGLRLLEESGAVAKMSALAETGVRVRIVVGVHKGDRERIQDLARAGLEFGLIQDTQAMGAVLVDEAHTLLMLRADTSSRRLEQARTAALLSTSKELIHLWSRLFEAQWKECPKVYGSGNAHGTAQVVVAS